MYVCGPSGTAVEIWARRPQGLDQVRGVDALLDLGRIKHGVILHDVGG